MTEQNVRIEDVKASGEVHHLDVVVIDDDPGLNNLLAKRLNAEGFETVGVLNASDGLILVGKMRPSLVILDYDIPDMNGLEIADEFKKRGLEVPIIVITGRGDEEIAVEMMKRGAIDYLVKKPNLQEKLPAIVRKALKDIHSRRRSDSGSRNSQGWSSFSPPGRLSGDGARAEVAMEAQRLAGEVKSRFMAIVSHELLTPLNPIIGYTEILKEECDDLRHQNYLGWIERSAQRLKDLINEIIDYTEDDGTAGRDVQPFSVVEAIESVMQEIEPSPNQNRIDLDQRRLGVSDCWVRGNEKKIRQVLFHLLENADKFTAKGQVRVAVFKTSEEGDRSLYRFEVHDTGIGVAPEVMESIFQPFVVGDDSRTRTQDGLGMGLALCKRTVDCLGGEIGVQPREPRGTTFWFTVPLESL